jgi:hypothetical protein
MGSTGMTHDNVPAPIESGLILVLSALRPYLAEIILIGGWVPYLYKRYSGIGEWTGQLSLTIEADVLLPRDLPAGERPTLADALRAAGLYPEGDSEAVWAGDPLRGERVEFLVPHAGTQRGIGRPTALRGQAGISALALDRLMILQKHTRTISIPTQTFSVRVPRLGAYLIQKAATFADRLAAKDVLYIRDVLAAGPTILSHIRAEIVELARADRDVVTLIRKGAQNLDGVVRGAMRSFIADAAAMRREREPAISQSAAAAEMEGRLHDALDLLRSATAREQMPRRGS